MPNYVLSATTSDMQISLSDSPSPPMVGNPIFNLYFTCANYFDDSVQAKVSVSQTGQSLSPESMKLNIAFLDSDTDDSIYKFTGFLNPNEKASNSIVSIVEANSDFSDVELDFYPGTNFVGATGADYFNAYKGLDRNYILINVPVQEISHAPDIYQLITKQDVPPTLMYTQFTDNLSTLTELMKVANKLNVRLYVELDPSLTLDQALLTGEDLSLFDHHVAFIWSPIRARPINAEDAKGKKVPRHTGGVLLAYNLKRYANVNQDGIPAIHRPVAGYDFPIKFIGIEQNPDVVLDDEALKALAEVRINVIQRESYPAGVRFVLADCLTAYGDNTSVLKLINASEISMFIDNRLKQICKRHLLKDIEATITDSLTEGQRFMDACTSKSRPLLRKSKVTGNYYTLNITPREDRPHDAVNLASSYLPQGTGRQVYMDTEVTK